MPAKQESNESAFKNHINVDLVRKIANSIHRVYPTFRKAELISAADELKPLELKGRVRWVSAKLKELLPPNYPEALKILLRSTEDNVLSGFGLWPYTDFIENYGLEHRDLSLRALYQLTEKFTGEFAVRPFLQKYEKETLKQLQAWATDKNEHVRRWVSEGTRPRLPWGLRLQSFIKDPSPTIPLLEKLKYDEELYVRKSVANHLNDIAKDHSWFLIDLLTRWQKEAPQKHQDKIDWITRHALRTLIKNGNPAALKLLGYGHDARVVAKNFTLSRGKIRVGEALEFSFRVECTQPKSRAKIQKLMIDYVVYHQKAGGKLSPKVFKLKNFTLRPGEKITVLKKHSFKKVTTRRYYAGNHAIEIQINGRRAGRKSFRLLLS
jgi:3-methyladenine DNA glycosylase AlkC